MKCDFCLEELKEGAAACPHCTREQLWSVEARAAKAVKLAEDEKAANAGCVAKALWIVLAIVAVVFILAKVISVNEQHEANRMAIHEAAEKACATFVSAGDYSSAEECASKANLDELARYSDRLEERCKALEQRASSASAACILAHSPSSKKCEKLAAIESSYMDWKACAVGQREIDRAAGLTPSAALKLSTQNKP